MRIVVIGQIHYNYSASTVKSLQELGHEVMFIEMVEFYKQCSYTERKLYKLGLKSLETKYDQAWNDNLIKACSKFKPDMILALNGIMMIKEYALEKLRSLGIKLSVWLLDSVKRLPLYESRIIYFDEIICFEESDLLYLKDKYGLTAYYCPVGFEEEAYYPDDKIERDIDISFVGNPTENRLKILNNIAQYAFENALNMHVQGVYWDKKYFWKKKKFINKNPKLVPYVHNFIVSSREAAEIYRRSKICLNIHVLDHEGINPRTFEILGTRSFQLMDNRKTKNMVRPGADLVTYDNTTDLLNKIGYYLANEEERKTIANNGYNWVKGKFSMKEMVKKIVCKEFD
ncbi:MAG: hypothetical protein H6Q69_1264 [Firmicutes bacterium]|nr:hypothetical protein [Bacillota bacterium]